MEKILFVSFHTRNIAINIMSSILKKDYIVDALFFIDFEVIPPNQQKIKINYLELKKLFDGYKYIMITVNHYTKNVVLKILKNMSQETRNKIVLGGPTLITLPDYFLGFVSHLCFWEGENIDDYLKHIHDSEKVPNFDKSQHYCQISNLDNVPLQNLKYDHYYFHIKNKIIVKRKFDYNKVYTLETIRGCPFSCTFCTNKLYNQIKQSNNLKLIRKKSLDVIFKELNFFKEKFSVIEIIDDNFFLRSLGEIKEFVSRYNKEINLTVHLNLDLRSKNFIKKFQEMANIKANVFANTAIANGDEDFRKNEFNRVISNKLIIAFDKEMHKIKTERLKIIYDLIWGHPCETESTIINNIKLIRQLKGRTDLYRYSDLFTKNNDNPFSNTDMLPLGNKSFLYMQMMFFVYLNNRNINIKSISPIRNKIICKLFSNYIPSKVCSYLLLIKSRFKKKIILQKAYHLLIKG